LVSHPIALFDFGCVCLSATIYNIKEVTRPVSRI
jgi:hypothetical protein